MSTRRTYREEYHVTNSEDRSQSTAWREYALTNTAILRLVMEEVMTKNDNIPFLLSAIANTVLMISSHLESLKKHKENFERLVIDASALVAVIWRVYVKLPASASRYIERLNLTMNSVYKLLTKVAERNLTERTIFMLVDLGKLKKYQQRIDSVAADLEKRPNKVNITEILPKVINAQVSKRPQYKRISILEEVVDDDGRGAVAEASRSPEVQKSTMIRREVRSEEGDKWGNKVLGKQKEKEDDRGEGEEERSMDLEEHSAGEDKSAREKIEQTFICPEEDKIVEQPKLKGTNDLKKAKRITLDADNLAIDEFFGREKVHRSVSYRPLEDEPDMVTQEIKYVEAEDDRIPGTSRQVSGSPKVNQRGAEKYMKREQVDIQGGGIVQFVSAKSPPKNKAPKKKARSRTLPSRSASGFTFTTDDEGAMINELVGNIYRH